MMVYIAADNSLPLVEWQEDVSVFCVTELSEDEQRVHKQFSKQYVYFVGAYTGCSCGFSYGDLPIEDEKDKLEDTAARASVQRLSEYLSDVVQSGSLEMFACWDGDQEAKPEEKLIVTPDFFSGESFSFKEKQFLTVGRSQNL